MSAHSGSGECVPYRHQQFSCHSHFSLLIVLCAILPAVLWACQVSWIDKDKLATFILQCQGVESFCVPCLDLCGGGIADRPGNMVDIFHTFFGISGLSLLGYFSSSSWSEAQGEELPVIDPSYALPRSVVERLGLPAQILQEEA